MNNQSQLSDLRLIVSVIFVDFRLFVVALLVLDPTVEAEEDLVDLIEADPSPPPPLELR